MSFQEQPNTAGLQTRRFGHRLGCLTLGLALVVGASPALAGEFYAGASLAISGGVGDPHGHNGDALLTSPNLSNHGADSDSSPVYAGVIGFEFPLHQVLPRRYRQPSWMPDIDIEDWAIRTELEAAGGRNYEFAIGARGLATHHVSVSSWSLMTNVWVDTPLGHALEAFGLRKFRDLTFNTGLGVGYQRTEIKSSSFTAFGAHQKSLLLWQFGAEFGLPLSDSVTLTSGYRYVPVGTLQNKLTDSTSTQNFGTQKMHVTAHEFRTGLRVNFHSVRFPRGVFDSRRTRYEP